MRQEQFQDLPYKCLHHVKLLLYLNVVLIVLLQGWPGLPRGVEFNPTDSDLLWHLAAEVGNGQARRHPFINEFIKSVDETIGFGYTHPQDIPGSSLLFNVNISHVCSFYDLLSHATF